MMKPFERRDRWDILGWPVAGRLLRSQGFLKSLQFLTLILFIIAIIEGFFNHDLSDNPFTTGLFWGLFWPFFIFFTTPTLGKIICGICPVRLLIFFTGRFSLNRKPPKWMNSGVVSIAAILVFYWFLIYAWPDILHSPWTTAVYFLLFTVTSIVITLIYKPSVWCKGICPVAVPTNIVSRMAFLGLTTYKEVCKDCRIATCAIGRPGVEGCPHGLNPSRMTGNADCTLCMKCVNSCSYDAIRFGFIKPLREFETGHLKRDLPEAYGTILLMGALTFTMQFYKGMSHGKMREYSPFIKLGDALGPHLAPVFSSEGIAGLSTFLFSLALTYSWYTFASYLVARRHNRKTLDMLNIFAWSALPMFALSSFAQVCEFFFFRYYPRTAEGFLWLFGLPYPVQPLAEMNSLWLTSFKIISIFGVLWSVKFTWELSGFFEKQVKGRILVSLPFWLMSLLLLTGFIAHIAAMVFLNMPEITGPRR